jgi:hypothetical protein
MDTKEKYEVKIRKLLRHTHKSYLVRQNLINLNLYVFRFSTLQ